MTNHLRIAKEARTGASGKQTGRPAALATSCSRTRATYRPHHTRPPRTRRSVLVSQARETLTADEFGARRPTIGSRSLPAVIARKRTSSSVTTAGRPLRASLAQMSSRPLAGESHEITRTDAGWRASGDPPYPLSLKSTFGTASPWGSPPRRPAAGFRVGFVATLPVTRSRGSASASREQLGSVACGCSPRCRCLSEAAVWGSQVKGPQGGPRRACHDVDSPVSR